VLWWNWPATISHFPSHS